MVEYGFLLFKVCKALSFSFYPCFLSLKKMQTSCLSTVIDVDAVIVVIVVFLGLS